MGKLKKVFLTVLIGLGAMFIMSAPVNAATKPVLQQEIEQTINTALDNYLATVDVKQAVNEVIDETLATFIDEMTKETFEEQIIQASSSALMEHIGDTQAIENIAASTGLQTTLENALVSSTYEQTNDPVKKYIKDYILNNLDGKMTTYNENMRLKYKVKRYEYGYRYNYETEMQEQYIVRTYWEDNRVVHNGQWVYEYTLYIISDREREIIKTTVGNKLDSIISIDYAVSNNVLKNTESMQFSQVATDYIKEHITQYTNVNNLLNKVRNDVKITVNDELRDTIATSIQTYIKSNSGQAIFTGIKDAIYYYIQQNGGLNKIVQDGFGDDTANYVSSQIGNIVKESIQYSLSPYVKELSQGRLKEVTQNITQEYVNTGAWSVIISAVNYNLDQMLATSGNSYYEYGGDTIRNNLVNYTDSYLARTTRIIDIINENLKSTKVEDHVNDYWLTREDGQGNTETYQNPKYDGYSSIGQYVLAETRSATKSYVAGTTFPQVVRDGKNAISSYMSGNGGALIKETLVNNVNNVFTSQVVVPLLSDINMSVAAWISNGIGNDVTSNIQATVKAYIQNTKDANQFSNETGIRLGEILKQVRYGGSSSSGRQISLEDLIDSKSLIGAERGRIVVPEENDANPLEDATLELGTYLTYKVKYPELSSPLVVNPYWTGITALLRFYPNPYGAVIGDSFVGVGIGPAGLSRTIAKYDTEGIKDLSPAEAYVLAHEKHTGYYPDRTQNAYYQVLEQIRGIKPKDDEGIVSKDTYEKITMAFGIVSVVEHTDWSGIKNNLSNAINSGVASEIIKALPVSTVASLLQASGIGVRQLLPFLGNDALTLIGMAGGLSGLLNITQTSLAHVVSWGENSANFNNDWNQLTSLPARIWSKVTDLGNKIWNTIESIPDMFTSTNAKVDQLTQQREELLAEQVVTEAKISELDNKIASATTEEQKNAYEQEKANLVTRQNSIQTSMDNLYNETLKLKGEYVNTTADIENKIKEKLGVDATTEAGQELIRSAKKITETNSQQGINTTPEMVLDKLGLGQTDRELTSKDLEGIDTSKVKDNISQLETTISKDKTLEQNLNDLNQIKMNTENYDSQAVLNAALKTQPTNDTLNQFRQVVNDLGVSMSGKSLPTVMHEVLVKWEQRPDFNADKAYTVLQSASNEMGLKMSGVDIQTLAKASGMTKTQILNKVTTNRSLADIVTTALRNNVGMVASLIQSMLPMKNEITDDYEVEEPMAATELAQEALALETAVNHWNDFEAKHDGYNLVDLTDYNEVKVAYSKNTDMILVGPFTIDYIREFYTPISPEDSEMVDWETGIISYTGIIGAELYADDEKTQVIEEWEFVYPDKQRSIRPYDDWAYEYPYPGEVFFLQFPSMDNYSINTLSRMTFELEKMDADGQTYQLSGGYDQLMWMTSGIPIPCPLTGACAHGFIGGVGCGFSIYWPTFVPCPVMGGPIYCPIHKQFSMMYDSQSMMVDKGGRAAIGAATSAALAASVGMGLLSNVDSGIQAAKASTLASNMASSIQLAIQDALPGYANIHGVPGLHRIGTFYFCFPIPLGTDLHAQNLEDIIYSKIYKEYQTVELEFGAAYHRDPVYQVYHNNNVNTTDVLFPAEHQGNLSIETDGVPQLPFLNNYEGYPGWEGYPYYQDNPNYPDNPYYPDNPAYSDYPSWPYYWGDPTYPYYPQNPVIPLTFRIEGDVWLDNPSGYEADADGIMDGNERGIPNVEVVLHKVEDPDNYIAKTLTDENGHYMFEYIRVGFDYYVEFLYDGMTYRTTKYLGSNLEEYAGESVDTFNRTFRENPEGYLDYSHAIEDYEDRDEFNYKFYEISQNMATGYYDTSIPMEYQTWYTNNGAVSTLITTDTRGITLDEYKMSARTLTTDWYFPLNDQYQVDYYDLDLYYDGSDQYVRTYEGLEHINLGLIQREQGDIGVRTDLYQIITTIKEDVQRYKYDDKPVDEALFDILNRNQGYYTDIPYNQELNPDDHAYRIDLNYGDYADLVGEILTEEDELNVYMEFKILIRNNATLHGGRVVVLENSFTQDLGYDVQYDYTDLTSWIETPIDGSEAVDREQIIWHYRQGTENDYSTIYTTDLQDKLLQPGEVMEVHLVLKVNKDAYRGIILDGDDIKGEEGGNGTNNGRDIKTCITEIHTYAYEEGLITKSANPGSMNPGYAKTYPDSADPAPLIKLILDRDYTTGNEITGYVWEDLIEGMLSANNQFIGNGIRQANEPVVDNVKVELIEVVTDKNTDRKVEVVRQTASRTDSYRTGQDIVVDGQTLDIQPGQYRFTKLETGIYKVKFTYGDEYQLSRDLTYNGQDYKSLALDTIIQQYGNPSLEVMILQDSSEGMNIDTSHVESYDSITGVELVGKATKMRKSIKQMIDQLYEEVQTAKVGAITFSEPGSSQALAIGLTQKPNKELVKQIFNQDVTNVGPTLNVAIEQALNSFSSNADAKVIIILTDGHMVNKEADRIALINAQNAGVKIVTVACSTDEWDQGTFGTEAEPTAGNLYNIREQNIYQYVSEVTLEDTLLHFETVLPNLTDAKDVEDQYIMPNGSKVGDVFSRKRSIDYSAIMTNENAEILDLDNIRALYSELNDARNNNDTKRADEISAKISAHIATLANGTKVTSVTPNRNIVLSHKAERTQEVNLGLVERPKLEVKLHEEVARIVVTLSNGQVIIDTARDLTQNVQIINKGNSDGIFSIYMDEEIMQGAKIDVDYIITITNNGQVDTLADYYTYDMFNSDAVAFATRTVPIRIGTLNNYYTNLTFRASDNTNLEVETNDVALNGVRVNGTRVEDYGGLIRDGKTRNVDHLTPVTNRAEDTRAIVLRETVTWDDKHMITLNDDVNAVLDNNKNKVVETTSLRNTELFPNMSKEVLGNNAESSINIYVKYTKNIAANDSEDMLKYDNSTEIVERLSDVGRRDYMAQVGDYVPQGDVKQYDETRAERVIILPPFGADHTNYYVLAVAAVAIIGVGIVFIKRKVL